MFWFRCDDGTLVELRPPQADEVNAVSSRLSAALSERTGMDVPDGLLSVRDGMFGYPHWFITVPPARSAAHRPAAGASHAGGPTGLLEVLAALPTAMRDAAVAAHLAEIRRLYAHREGLLSGKPVCAGCVASPEPEHLVEVEDALSVLGEDVLRCVATGRLVLRLR